MIANHSVHLQVPTPAFNITLYTECRPASQFSLVLSALRMSTRGGSERLRSCQEAHIARFPQMPRETLTWSNISSGLLFHSTISTYLTTLSSHLCHKYHRIPGSLDFKLKPRKHISAAHPGDQLLKEPTVCHVQLVHDAVHHFHISCEVHDHLWNLLQGQHILSHLCAVGLLFLLQSHTHRVEPFRTSNLYVFSQKFPRDCECCFDATSIVTDPSRDFVCNHCHVLERSSSVLLAGCCRVFIQVYKL